MAGTGEYGKAIGDKNRERVREFMTTHIGATNRECGKKLRLNETAVGRHIKAIRLEWLAKRKKK